MDKVKKDGTVIKDRAKTHVYIDLFEGDIDSFKFDLDEVLGIVKVKEINALVLFKKELKEINAEIITTKDNKNIRENKLVKLNDFLVMKQHMINIRAY